MHDHISETRQGKVDEMNFELVLSFEETTGFHMATRYCKVGRHLDGAGRYARYSRDNTEIKIPTI